MKVQCPLLEKSVNQMGEKRTETKIIAFYSPIGGVGKTTNVAAIAKSLACKNYKVLVYDCDPKSSVSLLLCPQNSAEVTCDNKSLYEQITSLNETPVKALPICDNLWFVPGDRRIALIDEDEKANHLTGSSLTFLVIYQVIMAMAKEYGIDFVLLDMSASTGLLNRCLVTASHYLVVPTTNDLLCCEAFEGMGAILGEWARLKAHDESDFRTKVLKYNICM